MEHQQPASPCNVLLIDDDRICRQGVKRAFQKAALTNPIFEAGNGLEALEMLRGTNGHKTIPRPFTILLDLNMPQMTGHEFLDELRDDPDLRDSCVFVITTSANKADLERCYQKNIAGYVMKCSGAAPASDLTRMLREYWAVVQLV